MREHKGFYRDLVLLAGVTLTVRLLTALPLHRPGYMDAYYYVDGALSLYRGRGFNDPFIWNYLPAPEDIPHPSHLYWMPLSSILAYLSFLILGPTYRAAQVPFVLSSSLLPVLSYFVAYEVAQNRRHAWGAGLFTTFSGFYMAYWVTPDNFAPFAVAGALCLFALGRGVKTGKMVWFLVAGLGAGFAHLARSDGALLLVVALLVGMAQILKSRFAICDLRFAICYLLFVICYFFAMGPWFVRNVHVIGRPLPTSGLSTLWLTDYDDLFSYGVDLSPGAYLAWGWGDILRSKLQGLWLNLQTLLFVDWMIALAPLGLIGVWRLRRRAAFVPAWLYGLLLYLVMSLAFTLPGVRGAMLHSSVALLPFFFAAAMEGLDALTEWVAARRQRWNVHQARRVFGVGLVCMAVALSAFLYGRALPGYRGTHLYASIALWMEENADSAGRVLVNDPAAFYYYNQRECLSVPNGTVEALLDVAERYNVRYLVLDKNVPSPLRSLYARPGDDERFRLLRRFVDQEGDAAFVYRIDVRGPIEEG
jgi:hypothetical protein